MLYPNKSFLDKYVWKYSDKLLIQKQLNRNYYFYKKYRY